VQATVNVDQGGRNELGWFEVIVPLVCGLAGLVALVIGIVLARPRRKDEPTGAETTAPAPVLDPAP